MPVRPCQLQIAISELGGRAESLLSAATDTISAPSASLKGAACPSNPRGDLREALLPLTTSALYNVEAGTLDPISFVATIRIVRDLEQIIRVCGEVIRLSGGDVRPIFAPQARAGLRHMGQFAACALKDVLDAYAQRDAERAIQVWERDIDLDLLEASVYGDVLRLMSDDPRTIPQCLNLLLICKHLERIGDFATNVAESVHELLTGQSLPLFRPKSDALGEVG